MLTAADAAVRETGIGASEAAALLGLDPYRTDIDVWLRKRTPTRAPLVPSVEPPGPQAVLGHAIEPVIRQLYIERTGIHVEPTATTRHPDLPFVLATADGLGERSGLEIKIVGSYMAHHWGDSGDPEGLPDYVLTQVVQNMAVFNRDRWDVAVLVGGTDLRHWTVERDEEIEASVLESDLLFWESYVEGDEPPPPPDRVGRRAYFAKRYPGSTSTKCVQVGDNADVAELVARLSEAHGRKKAIAEEIDGIEASLCEIVGNEYGIEGTFGKFLWYPVRGSVAWKDIAEELAGGEGKVPVAVMEKHRGEGHRVPRLYLASDKKARKSNGRR